LFIHHDVLAGVGAGTLDAPETSSASSVLMSSCTPSVKTQPIFIYQFGKQQKTNKQ
jgi:hypothetical protein